MASYSPLSVTLPTGSDYHKCSASHRASHPLMIPLMMPIIQPKGKKK